ncbi:glycosyltransferase [Paenibacillus oleatilyticus]|uniref:glycosyltransferase n=1 Tax=Paenibacillus oleatilyticus TaxID=2594886 RepID=UPI001C1FF8BF|nr:glycosyltransferase [Paenibacillus oleatilyticus]MBU7317608.1 glycosyltransferase [Paenibacillus oleatilyticus]
MKTSIVIATYNKLEYTQLCIESIREFTSQHEYEIIVVDNHSTDDTAAWLSSQSDITVIFNKENLGFPKACNQGIEISTGDNILLLNNDTIVTQNWLTNMLACLYSSEEVGAVGTVTNHCSYDQSIQVSYKSIEELHPFATQYNRASNPKLWEERLRLVGYCMLIKKQVLDEVGLLDERFTPGNFEDDDLSLRIKLAGYKLFLCRDTFIHHFGSVSFRNNIEAYNQLLSVNKDKFFEKWGFNPESTIIQNGLVKQIKALSTDPIRVLEMGSGCGGTLLYVRNHFPCAEVYGIETNPFAAKVATKVTPRIYGSLEDISHQYTDGFFDVIIVGNLGGFSDDTLDMVKLFYKLLNKNGQLIVIVPHLLYHLSIKKIIEGTINSDELKYWKLSDLEEVFHKLGFVKPEIIGLLEEIRPADQLFIQRLAEMAGLKTTKPYEIHSYLVMARKINKEQGVKTLINNLLLQNDIQSSVTKLAKIDAEEILNVIEDAGHEQKVELLNYIAVQFIEHQKPDLSLPYLSRAFELDASHDPTLFNLGLAMYTQGHDQLALDWLSLISVRDDKLEHWIKQIEADLYTKTYEKHKLKFLLRRLENDVEGEASLAELLRMLGNGEARIEQINQAIENDMVEKSQLLTQLAVACYEHDLPDMVFPFFEKALEFDADNQDALYLLARILYDLGEFDSARLYLNRVRNNDSSVTELMQKLSEVSAV